MYNSIFELGLAEFVPEMRFEYYMGEMRDAVFRFCSSARAPKVRRLDEMQHDLFHWDAICKPERGSPIAWMSP